MTTMFEPVFSYLFSLQNSEQMKLAALSKSISLFDHFHFHSIVGLLMNLFSLQNSEQMKLTALRVSAAEEQYESAFQIHLFFLRSLMLSKFLQA